METIDPLVWAGLLVLVGLALVVLEILIPSGGIIGLLSLGSMLAGIVMAFRAGGPTAGFSVLSFVVLMTPVSMGIAFYVLPRTPIGRILLGEAPKSTEVAPEDPRRQLIGRIGVARSKMLPSGTVEIDGQMIDAVAKGQAIEPGEKVQIVEVRANRVMVRTAPKDMHPGTSRPDDLLNRSIEELGIESLEDPLA
ncbi:NfeD family protein [Aeoliella mucimassa]|uniref:Uncharacterized protein n=1 Tax=Aeoliella mucimassa TaxID=2527972 RepID=A0A518AGX9_9BACT|nr:NfeD family protein [Aeoliella mucimassa]QDU53978.1 hypothetical protein Pan181_01570 [Aeoliella mucimassa]